MNTWLDQHKGQVWTYTTMYRPIQCGFTVPREGYLLRLDTDAAAGFRSHQYGLAHYSRELSKDEMDRWQLRFVDSHTQ